MRQYFFEGELIVGASGEYRKCGILTPEFAWKWVDDEMDNFPSRPQDPYENDGRAESLCQRKYLPLTGRANPLRMLFWRAPPRKQKKIGVDTGFVDTDSKWRNGIGEMSPDYVDQLFPKGFGGIKKEAEGLWQS